MAVVVRYFATINPVNIATCSLPTPFCRPVKWPASNSIRKMGVWINKQLTKRKSKWTKSLIREVSWKFELTILIRVWLNDIKLYECNGCRALFFFLFQFLRLNRAIVIKIIECLTMCSMHASNRQFDWLQKNTFQHAMSIIDRVHRHKHANK